MNLYFIFCSDIYIGQRKHEKGNSERMREKARKSKESRWNEKINSNLIGINIKKAVFLYRFSCGY